MGRKKKKTPCLFFVRPRRPGGEPGATIGGGRWEAGHRPTTTTRPMHSDSVRCWPMGHPTHAHHIHPHPPTSTAIGGGLEAGSGDGCGRPAIHPLRPPSRLSLDRAASEAIQHPLTSPAIDPLPPSNPIGFFRFRRPHKPPSPDGWGMTGEGVGRGLATARLGGCNYHGNSGHRTH